MINYIETQKYFKENNYLVIKNFLNENIIKLLFEYAKANVKAVNFKTNFNFEKYDEDWDGHWNSKKDSQVKNSYSKYGDVLFDTLCNVTSDEISKLTDKNLITTYTYWRLYTHGEILKKHKDRKSCKYSATVCLGFDVSNVDHSKYPDYDWPIFIKDKFNNDLPIHLKPGDILIYRGDIVEHWRDSFLGVHHAQVFFHYNEKDDKDVEEGPLDGRPLLGIPSKFRNITY